MSRKEKHENYSQAFAWIIVPITVAILALMLSAIFMSCGRIHLDCTTHQEKKAQRLLNKSYALCDKPFVALAAKRFNNIEYVHDSFWSEISVPTFDTVMVGDTVLITKTDTFTRSRTITKQVENKAQIEQLNDEVKALRDNLDVANLDEEKLSGEINTLKEKNKTTLAEKRMLAIELRGLILLLVVGSLIKLYLKFKV